MEQDFLNLLAEICGEEVLKSPDLDLYKEGLLDSLGMAALLEQVEDRFNLEIHLTQIRRDASNTPRKLAALVCGKLCSNL